MRCAAALLTLALTGCPPSSRGVPPNQDFELPVGQSIALQGIGLRVTFLDVPSDSRCPVDVVCVWAGNAVIRLHAEGSRMDTVVVLNSTTEPRSARAPGARIELLDLFPPPRSATPTAPSGYRAKLRWSPE